jgi:hypothetical protein
VLDAQDWVEMAESRLEMLGDNPVSVQLRRGTQTLSEQTVRITRGGAGSRPVEGRATQESRGRVLVWGDTWLNIQPEDRFTVAGALYRVVLVRPNRRAGVVAECEQAA